MDQLKRKIVITTHFAFQAVSSILSTYAVMTPKACYLTPVNFGCIYMHFLKNCLWGPVLNRMTNM